MAGKVRKDSKEKPKYCAIIGNLMNHHQESQQALADALGVTRNIVENWLGYRSKLDIENLEKVAEHYGVTTDYLLGLTTVRGNDASLRSAEEYTGLTETALQKIKELRPYAVSDLSMMLENQRFMEIVSCLDDLRAAYNRCARISNLVLPMMDGVPLDDPQMVSAIEEACISTEPDDPGFPDDALEEFVELYGDLRIQLFELKEMWSDCLESFIPTKEILADGKEVYRREIHGA